MNKYYYYFLLKRIVKFPYNLTNFLISIYTPKNDLLNKYDSVFVIGMAKTGTSSVREFLKLYGSKHMTINMFSSINYHFKNFSFFQSIINNYDSFDDKPFNRLDLILKFDMLKSEEFLNSQNNFKVKKILNFTNIILKMSYTFKKI